MPTSVTWNGSSYSIPQTGEFNWQSLTDFLVALGNSAQATTFQKIAVRVATTSPVTVSSANDCIVVSNLTVAGAVAVTLPPGVDKQIFFIVDGKGDAATNNVTITPDGLEQINGAASYVLNVNRGGIGIIYQAGQGWTVFAEFGNATGSSSYISRSKIEAGTPAHVIINDGSGFLSSEAQLASTRGGTGVSNAGTLTYGASNITLTTAGATTLTLPLTGTVATLTGTETLENKTLKTPLINGGSLDVDAAGALTVGASVGANNLTLGGATSTTIIPGNLTVSGTTTTVNTNTLDVKDKNITTNFGGNDASSEGAGITVDRTGTKGSIIYKDASPSKFALGALGAEANVVDESSTQTLTNKTLSGGTVSNSAVTASSLTVSGAANLNGGTTLGDAAGDSLTINSSAVSIPNNLNFDSNTLVIDAANNRVGIRTATPSKTLEVSGDVSFGTANVDSLIGNTDSLIIQPTGSTTNTLTLCNNPTTTGEQKQILIGPNALSGSTTLIQFGSSTSGAKNSVTFNGSQAVKLPVGNNSSDRPTSPANGMIRYNSTENVYEGYSTAAGGWSAIGGGTTVDRVLKNTHGFTIGDVLYFDGTNYLKAQANAANTAEVVGIVSRVIDTNNFELTLCGEVTGILSPASLTPGTVYFLSDATAGLLTSAEPTTIGFVSLPLAVAVTSTSLYFAPKRGSIVGSGNARTQITLANNATTTVQDVSVYDAGELAGWVMLTNTTAASSLRFYVQAPFAKYGGSSNYYISPAYVGDTPPASFAMTVTAGGLIQITMPNWSGYSSAVINFALNAPAVGTNFPLNLDSANLTNSGITGLTGAAATTAFTAGSGKVGEVITSGAVTGNYTTGAITAGGSVALTAGIWCISALVTVSGSGSSSSIDIAINTANNTFTGTTNGVDKIRFLTSGGYGTGTISNKVVKTTASSTTYYIIGQTVGANANCDTSITAFRIA